VAVITCHRGPLMNQFSAKTRVNPSRILHADRVLVVLAIIAVLVGLC